MRFQKRIQILPWVHLNISGSGISLSLGPPGLSVNLGKNGTRVTAGLPGTGLSKSHLFPSVPTRSGDSSIEAHHPGIDFSLLPPPPEDDDPLYRDAVSIAVFSRLVSLTMIQRNLLIGFSRAAALVDRMERDGIVTPIDSRGSREVIWMGMSPLYPASTAQEDDEALSEARFAEWLENYLEPAAVGITPLYSRGVLLTLTHRKLDPDFLANKLSIPKSMAETMIEFMAYDGIRSSAEDPLVPISTMDIGALRRSFDIHERQSQLPH